MKKLHTILMTLILLLSIGVHAAPVAHNNAATQVKSSGAKASVVFMIAAGVGMAASGFGVAILEHKDRKKIVAKKHKKEAKKAARILLRKRAEAEYAHRHASHKYQ
jgi:hypothetical protein